MTQWDALRTAIYAVGMGWGQPGHSSRLRAVNDIIDVMEHPAPPEPYLVDMTSPPPVRDLL